MQLRSRLEKLEKAVEQGNQWNELVRTWVGCQVHIELSTGTSVTGELSWIDRYTLCLLVPDKGETIVHKGAIVTLRKEAPG